ncbi:MAG TPA: PQQ-binding-like beta-propeller repeat protein [Acetobacteraceae bacterium]|nr:PQQ-binding-like beta-propeller repeat protein [Acetobacteraceae bacterium]
MLKHGTSSLACRAAGAALGLCLLTGTAMAAGGSSGNAPNPQDYANAASSNKNWILPAKDYSGNRYVTADQITPQNVKQMKPVWKFPISDDAPMEATPIIWHHTIYITSAHDHVYAIDAKTGKQKWTFSDNPHVIAFAANRGVALMDGNVYVATLDGHLIALNAQTGKKVFDLQTVQDPTNSFYTMAPIPYHDSATGQDMLLLGVADGDWGGIGNVSAYNAKNGKLIWRWETIPGPGKPGHNTWSGDSWKRGGGAVWSGMALNPKTQTLYIDAGNPQPDFLGTVRKGKNLYSNSMIALDISGKTPKMKWYHQFIPHDTHDWDPAMPPVLFTGKINGQPQKLVAAGDKGGNFWVLNADNGKLVYKTAVSFQHNQHTQPSINGNIACPNTNGGVEFNGGTYDPNTNTFYVPSSNECGLWKSTKQAVYIAGQFYLGGAFPKFVGPNTGQMNAINIDTGVFNWRWPSKLPMVGGALVTKTGLVFSGLLNGNLDAFDAKSGDVAWSYDTGSPITAPPAEFEMGGKEYIAVASGPAGNQQISTLPTKNAGAMLTVFALPNGGSGSGGNSGSSGDSGSSGK